MVYDGITRRQVLDLIGKRPDPAVSIYVPTARTGADVMQGRIKLKNLLVQAENRLVDRGMRRTLAIDLLKPITDLDNDPEFWNARLDAAAFFLDGDKLESFHLPLHTDEVLHVGRRFFVRPVLQMLNAPLGWYVLALDKGHIRLVHCSLRGAGEVHVDNMPSSMEEFVSFEHGEKRLQYHTAGPVGRSGSVIAHGAGDKGVGEKDRLNRLALAIARAAEDHLAASAEPVILAGTQEFQDRFRSVSKLRHLVKSGVPGSPKMLDLHELRAESEKVMEAEAEAPRKAALAHYAEMAGTGLTSQQLRAILPAAQQGRVDVLLARQDANVWGHFNGGLTVHAERAKEDEELINEAAVLTVENSGAVYEFVPGELSTPEPVGAIFRY